MVDVPEWAEPRHDEMPADIAEDLEWEMEEAARTIILDTTFRGVLKDGRKWKASILDVTLGVFSWTWEKWEAEEGLHDER